MEKNKYFKEQNNDLELYCSILLLPLIFCAVINYKFTSFFGGYILFGVYAFSCASLILFNRHQQKVYFDIKALLAFLCFGFVYAFLILISDSTESLFSIIFFSIAVFYAFAVVFNAANKKTLKFITVLFFISITISIVLSILVLIENPGASRVLAAAESFERYGASEYRKRGLAGFGVTYAMVFVVPLLFYWAKNNTVKKYKTLMVMLMIAAMVNIALSGYTTALLLLAFEIFLYVFINIKTYLKVLLILFLIIFAFFQSYFLPDFLYSVSEIIGSEQMADHIVELADILAGKAVIGDLDRTELIKISWDAFLTNPLLGGFFSIKDVELSGHSTFFDVLGGTGLIGFVPYALFLWLFYKQVRNQIKNSETKKIWFIETVVFFALQFLNPIMANYEIVYAYMAMVPATLFYIDLLGEE